jgi:hypothetical protein
MLPDFNDQGAGPPAHSERRKWARLRPSSVAYVKLGPQNGGVVLDVSENGLQLSAGETLTWDDAVPLSLQLTYRANPIEATGKIVWLAESRRTAGLQFVALPENSRSRLREWIASEQSGAGHSSTQDQRGGEPRTSGTIVVSETGLQPAATAEAAPSRQFEVSAPVSATTRLPSDRLLRKRPGHEPVAPSNVEEQPATGGPAHEQLGSAHEQGAPSPLTASLPAPSRWGRSDTAVAPASDVDSMRQLFKSNQVAEMPDTQAAQAAGTSGLRIGVGGTNAVSPLAAEDTGVLKFGEWARTRHETGPRRGGPLEDFEEELDEARHTSAFRIVFIGGLMLLCFAVGLILGVNWLSKPMNPSEMPPVGSVAGAPNPDASANASNSASASASTVPSNARAAAPDTTHSVAAASPGAAPQSSQILEPTAQQTMKPAASSVENPLPMNSMLEVTPPSEGAPAMWVRLPQIALSASASVAISVQQSVLVPPASPGSPHSAQLLVGGRIANSSVQPLVSASPIDPNGDAVHLRVWVDQQGDIKEIMPGDGRSDLIAIGEGEIRGWLQTPARLGGKPVESVEDVTITFRPTP